MTAAQSIEAVSPAAEQSLASEIAEHPLVAASLATRPAWAVGTTDHVLAARGVVAFRRSLVWGSPGGACLPAARGQVGGSHIWGSAMWACSVTWLRRAHWCRPSASSAIAVTSVFTWLIAP